MKVLFIRHGIAAERTEHEGNDLSRPLTAEGERKARKVFAALKKVYPAPDALVSSKALRAEQTARIFAEAFGMGADAVTSTDLLNPGADFENFRKVVESQEGKGMIALFGHEPDFSEILSLAVSGGELEIGVKKASCIEVDLEEDGTGILRHVLTPKIILGLAG